MAESIAVYLFRDPHFAPARDTVVCAAPHAAVVNAFGGGGLKETSGLSAAFSGVALFRDDSSGEYHLGVWGARNASQFRSTLQQAGFRIEIVKSVPPGRLAWYSTR